MNELKIEEDIKIENMIYEIRGKQVMLDSDLAKLYECANGTKSINLAVKRHINRFPERFMFQLTEEESNNLRFQIETKKNIIETRGGKYNKPYVFTEQGIAMLATVLKTKVAEEVSIKIMDAFVSMRKFIQNENLEYKFYKNMVLEHDKDIKLLKDTFNNFNSFSNEIFYKGQIYDAYSLLIDILSKTKKEIILIDNYAGKKLFDITKEIKVKIKIYTENIDNTSKDKYEEQYHNLEIINTNKFHDRFIIIDRKILYHSGASFKDLGKKCFAITVIEDNNILKELLKKLL